MFIRDGRNIRRQFKTLRRVDLLVSVALACGFIFYVLSLFNTSVANTVLLLSTGPFIAALFGFVVLREVISASIWIAMLIAGAGVAVMMSGDLNPADFAGIGYALLAVTAFAVMVVTLRAQGVERDMMAATALAGLVAALFLYSVSGHT